VTYDLLIGGHSENGRGREIEIENPATAEVAARVRSADAAQVDAAVKAAADVQPSWRRVAQDERSESLRRIAASLLEQRARLAEVLTIDTGRPYTRNLLYVDFAAGVFRQYAELARLVGGSAPPPNEPGQLSLVLRVPYGVVGCLIPWNYPLLLLAFKVAPALATGNTVVVKGAPETTLSTLSLLEIFQAHTPPGVVNLLAGGAAVGEQLVAHDGVDLVAFTGSTGAGRLIGARCAELTKPAHLELGGKDPAVVFGDVDTALAARAVVWAAFLNAGQVCTSTERVYVARSSYDEFVDRSVELAASLRVGDPMDVETQIGPMRSEAGRARALGHVTSAVAAGAEVLVGGDIPPGPGYFLRPTVVAGVDHTMDLMREETFGPVMPIMAFDGDDEAFSLAADTPYGLGASVYTADPERVRRAYEDLRVGTVWVNDPVVDNPAAPFGGMRASGNARELGVEGLAAFTDPKHVHWNLSLRAKPWWYPFEE
jgi:betaine-aldehyde dehydrogenase